MKLFFIMLLVSLTGLLNAQNNAMTTESGDEASTSILVKGAVLLEPVSIGGEIDVWLDIPYTYFVSPSYSNWTYVWEIEKDHRCSFSTSDNVLYVTFNQTGVYHITCRVYDENMNYVGDASIEALTRYP